MLDKLTDTSGYTIFTNETDRTSYRESLKGVLIHPKQKINSYTMFIIEKWMKRFNLTGEDLK